MTENKYQDRILETIDQLRKRKARPDLERICHMVERRYGISPAQTQGELERLVDSEIVIKVDYKGSTSYRNAAKWGKKKALSGQVLNSNDVSRTLCEAVRALLPELQQTAVAAAAQGVNIREIEKYIVSHNALSKLTKNKLQVALDREVSVSRIQKLPNGNYVVQEPKPVIKSVETAKPIAPSNPKPDETDALPTPTVPPLQAVKPVPGSARKGRPPNKRKRFKKTHGPDFVENYDSSFEEPEPKCDYCLLTATSNCNGKPEELLVCKDCNAKAHPSCMDYSADLAIRSRMSPWQCMDCKTCYICNDSGEADSMLFCDACDKGYHMSCHSPKVTTKPNGKWVCHPCSGNGSKKGNFNKVLPMDISEAVELNEMEQTKQTIDGAPGLPTPCESPVPDSEQNKKSFSDIFTKKESSVGSKENKDPEVPDASDWSIEDVENYFKLAGFPDQALAFKEQEIDGKSLLLMKRSDVLTGLSIKLGPALKIYNHVKRLQTRRLDGHLIY